ncbi:glycosyl hydrolase 115 family protein [Chitinophaga sp. XS-30]|uniref:glycosyl hydrolase 115 family protein n=1 Tax=Chitinophaga sp. XS-30 TaxID=2604421 RepID=UPI0011DD2BD6|nr:glycosyl hydrolase 115 family protein [Chitinophaga sp. XS-30]QEH40986.1 glycosyhydrolase [Chitinophaga sp. XS-30]
MKKLLTALVCLSLFLRLHGQTIIETKATAHSFTLGNAHICVAAGDDELVRLAAGFLQKDLAAVTGRTPGLSDAIPAKANTVIIIGSLERSPLIRSLIKENKLDASTIKGKWEAYTIRTISNPFSSIAQAIVIAGSDRRGTAYGIFELSRQLGVSPWYWWADVPVKKKDVVHIRKNASVSDTPRVKYRGIFINDEAPALSGWSREKFGGFNHTFYEKVFELILRLKGNYIWPAMWGNAFYDDDSLNINTADRFGIVIGTSHHEPLMRAHDEWRRYGSGLWNYDSNAVRLQEFWRAGLQRAWNEKIVTIGMRGDGDKPMSRETATALLERIVKDQRNIISATTGKPAAETPQLWALYKEVQDYYDKGMSVPDDVTLLLCDDNWGNIRRLPDPHAAPRKGGYGIYYHFDYVGGPRNYKWLNTNPLPRIWEQLHLAYRYNARQIWIVNVGDIKPMEFPISFFLDYAWDPERINADDLQSYTEQWAAEQFGQPHAAAIAELVAGYGKYNSRRKPELLDAGTYSFNYNEWDNVVEDYNTLLKKAEQLNTALAPEYRDAFFQLVLHPVKACANLNEMYYHAALNHRAYAQKQQAANMHADKVQELYRNDSLITLAYHQLNNGKWNHMMSQAHIGYTYWQQPPQQKMPAVKYLSADAVIATPPEEKHPAKKAPVPANVNGNVFYEDEWRGVSIAADHFTSAVNTNGISWQVLPDHGRTGSAITPFPVTAAAQNPGGKAPHVVYEFYTYSEGPCTLSAYCSPTLNFTGAEEGLQYAVSIDDETPQIISINKEDKATGSGIWNKWVAENIIIKTSKHYIAKPGKHHIRYWMVDPGVVLQQLVLDFGHVKQSYLGPPETIHHHNKK